MELIISALLFIGLPFSMLVMLRSNIGMMFLSACSGIVLLSTLDVAVVSAAGSILPGEGEAYVRLAVVIVSAALTGLFFKASHGFWSGLLNGFIAVMLGLTLWLILPNATGLSWLIESQDSSLWQNFADFQTVIIALGFGLSLVSVLQLSNAKKHKKSKSHS